jgi:hypothetical protein
MRASTVQNRNKTIVRISALKVFVSFLGGFLIYDMYYLLSPWNPPEASKKHPGSNKKFQGRNSL